MQNGLEVTERDFFQETFTDNEIRTLATMVGTENIFARRSPSLKKMGLGGKELSEDAMVNLMMQEPKLVRRPLLKVGDRLLVGCSSAAVEAAIIEAK